MSILKVRLKDRYERFKEDFLNKVIEIITSAVMCINSDHAAIHKGLGFCLSVYHASLAAGAKKIYRFQAPEDFFVHFKSIQISLQGATCAVRLKKEATITNAGIEIENVVNNLNHNSARQAQTKIFDGSVAYTGGQNWCDTIVHGDTAGGGVNLSRSSGNFIQSDYLEYVTKDKQENYILEIENLSAQDTAIHIQTQIFFYEENKGLTPNNNNNNN